MASTAELIKLVPRYPEAFADPDGGKHIPETAKDADTPPLNQPVDEVKTTVIVSLPETNARQGTKDCPNGMCSMD